MAGLQFLRKSARSCNTLPNPKNENHTQVALTDGGDESYMPTMLECNQLMEEATETLKPCPCCGQKAFVKSYDYMTITAGCGNIRCRLKVERGIINSRTFQRCLKMVVRAWNRRPRGATLSPPGPRQACSRP